MKTNSPDGGVTTSPWEDTLLAFDVVVVGAGIIGLSSAIELAERSPSLRVAVLERGLLPTGASTRNAGFACFGSAGEIFDDISRMGQKGAMAVVAKRIEGLRKLKTRCADADIGVEEHGGHELFFENAASNANVPSHGSSNLDVLAHLDELNALLEPMLGPNVFTRRDDLVNTFNFGQAVRSLVHIKHESTLHSGRLIDALWRKAQDHGVRVLTGALVTRFEHDNNGHHLTVHSIAGERTVVARSIILATNGNMSQIQVPKGIRLPTFEPARGQVLLTAPIEGLALRGSFHFDSGFYYFRNLGNRILLGGGRNTDFEGERTHGMGTTQPLQQHLEEILRTVIAPRHKITIERRWAGTMSFTTDKQPLVLEVDARVYLAFGCNGMGVALGSNIAADVADRVLAA